MQHSFIYRKKMRTDFELENDVVTLLKHHDLRLTQVRKEVLSVFLKKEQALSQSDIEENVGQIDRITLYRTLRSFEDNGLIHRAIDGFYSNIKLNLTDLVNLK